MKLLPMPCYCATLRQAARAVTVLYEEALRDSGLHATQYTMLQVLEMSASQLAAKGIPGLTTTELAQGIGIDQTTATRTLALIKKAGLASGTAGRDRRERRWSLTPAGQALVQKLKPRWEAAQRTVEQRLGRADAAALKKAAHLSAVKLTDDH